MSHQPHKETDPAADGFRSPEMNDAMVLQGIISKLTPLPSESRRRIIDTVCMFFGIARAQPDSMLPAVGMMPDRSPASSFRFSESEAPTPKEFMGVKAPTTDVERVACLAYYLTHYRGTPHFKTRDISDINIEAAQRLFSNTAFAVANATNSGYLVPSVKGCKQLSAIGEQFVQTLPDRDAAREVQERLKPRRGVKRTSKKRPRASKS